MTVGETTKKMICPTNWEKLPMVIWGLVGNIDQPQLGSVPTLGRILGPTEPDGSSASSFEPSVVVFSMVPSAPQVSFGRFGAFSSQVR